MCHFPAAVKREASVETGDTIAFLYGSSIAESAVNEVVSLRCAKKRQMRWTNKGAHLLVQVRVAVLNGDLKMREMGVVQTRVALWDPASAVERYCCPII